MSTLTTITSPITRTVCPQGGPFPEAESEYQHLLVFGSDGPPCLFYPDWYQELPDLGYFVWRDCAGCPLDLEYPELQGKPFVILEAQDLLKSE